MQRRQRVIFVLEWLPGVRGSAGFNQLNRSQRVTRGLSVEAFVLGGGRQITAITKRDQSFQIIRTIRKNLFSSSVTRGEILVGVNCQQESLLAIVLLVG